MKARHDLSAQLFFAAKKVAATGDIEKQAFWRIENYDRREPLTPRGYIIQSARVFFGICLDCLQLWLDRARVR